jgi:hypothetical protein
MFHRCAIFTLHWCWHFSEDWWLAVYNTCFWAQWEYVMLSKDTVEYLVVWRYLFTVCKSVYVINTYLKGTLLLKNWTWAFVFISKPQTIILSKFSCCFQKLMRNFWHGGKVSKHFQPTPQGTHAGNR